MTPDYRTNAMAAASLAFAIQNEMLGGGDGIVCSANPDALKVVAFSPPTLAVMVKAGYAFIAKLPFVREEDTWTAFVQPPHQYSRIDLVVAEWESGEIVIRTGTEAESPSPPEAGRDCLVLARLHLRPKMKSIKDIDDGVNGFIVDVRTLLGLRV